MTRTMHRLRLGLLVAVVLLAVGPARGTPAAVRSTAAARWHLLPKRVAAPGAALLPLGWAPGRAWFFSQAGATGEKLSSARVGRRRLTSFVTSGLRPSGNSNRVVLGSSILLYPGNGATQIAQLHSDGRIGDPKPLAGDPESKAKALFRKDLTFRALTGATVGGRTVWVMERVRASTGERPYMVACCTTSGEARDLTALFSNRKQGVVSGSENLGVDRRGQLWLFWTECVRFCRTGRNRAVRLDRETLVPGKPSTAPQQVETGVPRGRLYLVCAATCRAVFGGGRAIQTWDGHSPPRTLARIALDKELLAAGGRRGKLIIAYESYKPGRLPRIVLKRGNARGSHLKTRRSIKLPLQLGRRSAIGSPLATFTPRGVVVIQGYGISDVSRYGATVLR
jgi:hypothetical protein